MKHPGIVTLISALLLLTAIDPAYPQFQPPHTSPGPGVDRIRFRAVAVEIAPAAIQRGDIDLYLFSLKTAAARELLARTDIKIYQAPASTISIILNPAPAPPGQLNPLSIREVRYALQFLIDRGFVVSEIYRGLAAPMVAHVNPFDYDYLTVFDLVKEMNIRYDPEYARRTITEAMTRAGAVMKDGLWHYQGRPISLRFIIRVEDERREVGDLLASELSKQGFQVERSYQFFGPAIQKVYGTDPKAFEWHLYTEGWGRLTLERYDFALINQMYAPWLGNMPGWREVGFWQYENPRLDQLGQRIFRGEFRDERERAELYREATRLGIEDSVRIWVAAVINSFPARAELRGVTEDLAAGPRGIWTLREAHVPGRRELTVGNLWVWTERSTWNPVGGFRDIYSLDIWRPLHDPPLWRDPFTGLPIPFRADFTVVTAGPGGKLEVPRDAFIWDAAAGRWAPVPEGTKATSRAVFNYAKYFTSKWHHGQPIGMADVLYSIHQTFDIAYNPDKSRIEFAIATTSRPYLDTFRGFRILNSTSLEVYVDFWHFVPSYIAEYASPSSLSMPWELLYAMDILVFSKRQAAYTDTAAQRFNVPWLSLVVDLDARLVQRVLKELLEKQDMPENVFTLAGTPVLGKAEALNRYRAAIQWFENQRHLVISNGPFKLARFDSAAQFAEIEAFRDPTYPYRPGSWFRGSLRPIEIGSVRGDRIPIGEPARVTVEARGPGNIAITYLLVDPSTGRSVAKGDAARVGPNTFEVVLSPQLTSQLKGLYQLVLLAHSDSLSILTERTLSLQAAPPTPPEPAGPAGGTGAVGPTPGISPLALGIALAIAAAAASTLIIMRRRRR